ncbi:hypothetical protein SO802_003381 [Lithocarpus litseifolius]|uniref:Uncharacterized protein n=1 Tax=Lithocarpus litseifolius TaxID=425828 RepID=A0AAW2DZY1_9ROSI
MDFVNLTIVYSSNVYADKRHFSPRLSLVNVTGLNKVLQSEIFASADGQLRAIHVIFDFQPLSTAFQDVGQAIRAGDPRIHRIDVLRPDFLAQEDLLQLNFLFNIPHEKLVVTRIDTSSEEKEKTASNPRRGLKELVAGRKGSSSKDNPKTQLPPNPPLPPLPSPLGLLPVPNLQKKKRKGKEIEEGKVFPPKEPKQQKVTKDREREISVESKEDSLGAEVTQQDFETKEWIREARNEAKAQAQSRAKVEKSLGTLKHEKAELAKKLTAAERARLSVESFLKSVETQAEEQRQWLHLTKIELAT